MTELALANQGEGGEYGQWADRPAMTLWGMFTCIGVAGIFDNAPWRFIAAFLFGGVVTAPLFQAFCKGLLGL